MVFLISIQAVLVSAQPTTWPTEEQWMTPGCDQDPSDESPSQLDIISVDIVDDGYHPAVYYFEDDNYFYMRERIEGDPNANGKNGNLFTAHNWVLVVENTGDVYYDYLFTLNGNDEMVQIWENTAQSALIDWLPIFNDPAETIIWTGSTADYAKIDSDGTGHWFVSWAIPKTTGSFVLSSERIIFFSTSANANNYNKDHLDCYESECGNGIVDEGEECDPGVADPNDCCSDECLFELSDYTCRESAGVCDLAEQCTGSEASCPSDIKSTDVCRPAFDTCDLEEVCDGVNDDCPTDSVREYGYVCDYDEGQCEADDICDGIGKQCDEIYAQSGTSCDDGLYCSETDECDGNNNCVQKTERDCSYNNIFGVSTCNNDPDNNQYTWDFRNPFTSVCDEEKDICTQGNETITHECHDCDPNDGIGPNGELCCASCDQDQDCTQTTGMCDYENRQYCTRDSYGTCNDQCGCDYDQWSCSTEGYCENCNHCGDDIVNCGEDCEIGQVGDRCLPENASIITCLNNVSYVFPEFDSCEDNCMWNNCEQIVTPNDPRCQPPSPPTCKWCSTRTNPFTVEIPTYNVPTGSFAMPSYTAPTYTVPKTTSSFTVPTYTIPTSTFSMPTFNFK